MGQATVLHPVSSSAGEDPTCLSTWLINLMEGWEGDLEVPVTCYATWPRKYSLSSLRSHQQLDQMSLSHLHNCRTSGLLSRFYPQYLGTSPEGVLQCLEPPWVAVLLPPTAPGHGAAFLCPLRLLFMSLLPICPEC